MDDQIYHVTSTMAMRSIASNGLNAGSYLTNLEDLAGYYSEVLEDEGLKPVVLLINTDGLDVGQYEPDYNGMEEPIMTVVRKHSGLADEEELFDAWSATEQSWEDSLSLIGSMRFLGVISPDRILRIDLDTGKTFDFVERLNSNKPPAQHFGM